MKRAEENARQPAPPASEKDDLAAGLTSLRLQVPLLKLVGVANILGPGKSLTPLKLEDLDPRLRHENIVFTANLPLNQFRQWNQKKKTIQGQVYCPQRLVRTRMVMCTRMMILLHPREMIFVVGSL